MKKNSENHSEYRDRHRLAIVILQGAKGDNRLIRKIVGEEIKRVVGKQRWKTDVFYSSVAEMSGEYGEPTPARFSASVTNGEFEQIMQAVGRRFVAAGWPEGSSPIDAYHD